MNAVVKKENVRPYSPSPRYFGERVEVSRIQNTEPGNVPRVFILPFNILHSFLFPAETSTEKTLTPALSHAYMGEGAKKCLLCCGACPSP